MKQPSQAPPIFGNVGGVKIGDAYPVRIMGVINLTKNSFYSGSVFQEKDDVIESAIKMERDGADFVDVGARSTAPYRKYDVSKEEETRLIRKVVGWLDGKIKLPISVDTTRLEPARASFEEGARILNDVYGLTQRDGVEIGKLVSKKDCSIILTSHEIRRRKGTPLNRVLSSLEKSIERAMKSGVNPEKIAIDPGIGFFSDPEISNVEWNCKVISDLEALRKFHRPICVGISRKRFVGMIGGDLPPEGRISGSLAATAIAVYNGCHMVRTHDVAETVNAVRMAEAIRGRQKRLSHNSWEEET